MVIDNSSYLNQIRSALSVVQADLDSITSCQTQIKSIYSDAKNNNSLYLDSIQTCLNSVTLSHQIAQSSLSFLEDMLNNKVPASQLQLDIIQSQANTEKDNALTQLNKAKRYPKSFNLVSGIQNFFNLENFSNIWNTILTPPFLYVTIALLIISVIFIISITFLPYLSLRK